MSEQLGRPGLMCEFGWVKGMVSASISFVYLIFRFECFARAFLLCFVNGQFILTARKEFD